MIVWYDEGTREERWKQQRILFYDRCRLRGEDRRKKEEEKKERRSNSTRNFGDILIFALLGAVGRAPFGFRALVFFMLQFACVCVCVCVL